MRFFCVLVARSDQYQKDRLNGINLIEFIELLNQTIYSESERTRLFFVFQMYDLDRDSFLSTVDCMQLADQVPPNSSLGQEFQLFRTHIVKKQLKPKKSLDVDRLRFSKFIEITQRRPCLLQEFRERFLQKPDKVHRCVSVCDPVPKMLLSESHSPSKSRRMVDGQFLTV